MGSSFPGLGLGGDPPPSHLGKQLLDGSHKPEGFLLDRNAHGPHLLQLLEHLVSGPPKGVAVLGVGSSVSPSNNWFIVTMLFVFSVFCLTWQLGREKAAGSL